MVHIYDPARAEYNEELQSRISCYFCDKDVIQKQECTKFVFNHWMVLTNKHPYMNGNVMLIPKKHSTKISDLSKEEWDEFPSVLILVQDGLSKMFQTESFNIGINIGEDSGRSVEHLHWQVIPRKKKNHTVVGVLADIHVITLSPDQLKKRLSV